MTNIFRKFRQHRAKIAELGTSVSAGLLAGIPVTILFYELQNATTKNHIYGAILAFFIVLFLSTIIGTTVVYLFFKKKYLFSYYTNFIAGLISSSTLGFLVMNKNNSIISLVLALFSILFFILVSYLFIKTKRPK